VTPFVTAGAGFLLAVLWFDLMFDVQVVRHRDSELPESVLSSIAGYYRRVTTAARPMNRLIAAVMVGTIAAIVVQLTRDDAPRWAAFVSLALTAGAVSLAAVHTVPSAIRLGSRTDTIAGQSQLARSILRDHLLCILAVAGVLFVQLAFAR
jgi:ER membrane protein SH3